MTAALEHSGAESQQSTVAGAVCYSTDHSEAKLKNKDKLSLLLMHALSLVCDE